jgi:AAA domain
VSETTAACPACRKPAIFMTELDRYLHADGSPNDACWLTILRGNGASDPRAVERLSRLRDRLVDGPQVLDLPEPGWVVEGVIPAGGLVLPYGPPKSGKSLVAIDLALSVANGRPHWCAHAVNQGNVLVVAAEGVGGLAARVGAWLKLHDYTVYGLAGTYWLTTPVNLFDADEVYALLDLVNEHVRPVLIVFDTLARCTVGAEENSAKDMGQVVAALDRIRTTTGAAVVVVHHAGKITSSGPRGSSALLGAVDAAFEITGDGQLITMRCTAMKDAAIPPAVAFKMIPAGTSVALHAYDAAATAPESVEKVLATLVGIDTGEGVSASVWEGACECSRRAFFYAKKWLVDAGKVGTEGSGRSLRFFALKGPG